MTFGCFCHWNLSAEAVMSGPAWVQKVARLFG